MLGQPNPTSFDLHFEIFGFPVRVHPLHWALGAYIGYTSASPETALLGMIVGMVVVFASILIHELGHAVMMRRYGQHARIVLHMMGGYAIADRGFSNLYMTGDSFRPVQDRSRFRWNQIIISLAGPGAQLILAAIVIAFFFAGSIAAGLDAPGALENLFGLDDRLSPHLMMLVRMLLFINIFWPIFNLLPIYPMDGGQVMREIVVGFDPWNGQLRSLWISLIAAVLAAGGGFLLCGQPFFAIFFGFMAFQNWQMIQQLGGGGGRRPW